MKMPRGGNRLLATQEQLRAELHLEQAVVGAAKHRLRLADRVDLTGARLLANIEVLKEEVAVAVELGDVLAKRHQVRGRCLLVLLSRTEVALETRFLSLFLGNRLAVGGTLRSALRHELLVVLLRLLLIHFVGLDLHLELVRELLDERGRAAGALFLVRAGRGGATPPCWKTVTPVPAMPVCAAAASSASRGSA